MAGEGVIGVSEKPWLKRYWVLLAAVLLVVQLAVLGGLLLFSMVAHEVPLDGWIGGLIDAGAGYREAQRAAGSGPADSLLVKKGMSERVAAGGTRTAPPGTPEYTVYEYFQAIEARDVDRLFSLGSKTMMNQQIARKGARSVGEFKAKWAPELNELADNIERTYGQGWSRMITAWTTVRGNDRVRVQVTSGYETEPIGVYVVKEDGQWKMQTWLFD